MLYVLSIHTIFVIIHSMGTLSSVPQITLTLASLAKFSRLNIASPSTLKRFTKNNSVSPIIKITKQINQHILIRNNMVQKLCKLCWTYHTNTSINTVEYSQCIHLLGLSISDATPRWSHIRRIHPKLLSEASTEMSSWLEASQYCRKMYWPSIFGSKISQLCLTYSIHIPKSGCFVSVLFTSTKLKTLANQNLYLFSPPSGTAATWTIAESRCYLTVT